VKSSQNGDPYRVLGVDPQASDSEIRRAYRRLARQYHPDRNPGDEAAESRFKELQQAHEKIGSPESRRKWDERGTFEHLFSGSSGFSDFFRQPSTARAQTSGGLEDLISNLFGGSSPRQHSRPTQPAPKGRDLRARVEISLMAAEIGCTRTLRVDRPIPCKPCRGGGVGSDGLPCLSCEGNKSAKKVVEASIRIPKGVTHGQDLRLRSLGEEIVNGKTGDLLVRIDIDPGSGRRWDNGRLIQEVPLAISTMLLGGHTDVKSPTGSNLRVEIPPSSRPGDRRRLSGQGINGDDLDLEFILDLPEDLTSEQVDALRAFDEKKPPNG